ncbi:MAG: GNAT family N-acyltransferase [Balneolaceae bacterium]
MILEKSILQGIENHKYLVKIAETDAEVERALRLRYNVFGKELDRNFNFKGKIDYDDFDDQCHHLLVIDKDSDSIIGTYRLQTYQQAESGNGFVTAKRFELELLSESVLKEAFEVGRVCISHDHRNGRVLYLLWKGLAAYLQYFQLRYLFGFAALNTKNPDVAMNTYHHLLKNGYVNTDFQVNVRSEYQIIETNGTAKDEPVDIPPLFRNYLDVGTKICSKPAYDSKLGIYHFFILMDIETISDRTRRMFFG